MDDTVHENDTIAAVATPPGRGAIGIIRISGDRAVEIASRLFRGTKDPREMGTFTFAHGWILKDGKRMDEALCLVTRAPKSYTTEDVVELHCHGGPASLKAVLRAVIEEGARPAEPGEFTRRAFLSGRVDLAQAEAVADLVAGETEAALRLAAAGLSGALSGRVNDLKDKLAETLALVEAGIDFADEEDVVAMAPDELDSRLADFEDRLAELVEEERRGRLYREGARVVIAGKPNVGKSTLMNALLGADRVIVTAEPGATRDVVEDLADIAGVPVRLFDTAGIHDAKDETERVGVDRARAAIESADLVVFMIDGSVAVDDEDRSINGLIDRPVIIAVNKDDLPRVADGKDVAGLAVDRIVLDVSALKGHGLAELKQAVASELAGAAPSAETETALNMRRLDALTAAARALGRAREAVAKKLSDEFIAGDLHEALDRLGLITGETATDDILDIIFSRFCIGK